MEIPKTLKINTLGKWFHYSVCTYPCTCTAVNNTEILSPTQIFDKTISTSIFPTDWKLARVTPIFKKCKKDDLDNYRLISIISVVAKIFEKLIVEQLYEYLNNNNLKFISVSIWFSDIAQYFNRPNRSHVVRTSGQSV